MGIAGVGYFDFLRTWPAAVPRIVFQVGKSGCIIDWVGNIIPERRIE